MIVCINKSAFCHRTLLWLFSFALQTLSMGCAMSSTTAVEPPHKLDNFLKNPYKVFGFLFFAIAIAGFIYSGPAEIARGLWIIITSQDILVTDYIEIAGMGATLVNVGLAGLMSIGVLIAAKHEPDGATLVVLWLASGFAFFGKNIANMTPIILGGFLFAKFKNTPLKETISPVLLGTSLSPAVTQTVFIEGINPVLGVTLGIFAGIMIGFIIAPISRFLRASHEGYNLYGVGFAAGIVGFFIMAVYYNLGIGFETLNIWSYGNNVFVSVFLGLVSVYLIIIGLLTKLSIGQWWKLREILHMRAADVDFFEKYREKAYISMGINGIVATIFVIAIGGQLSGPAIGGIFTIIGFSAYGKRLLDIAPVVLGTILAGLLNTISFGTPLGDNLIVLTMLFSTCLAPLTRDFGWKWGILAGFLHLNLATNLSIMHGGMNLYNNGLAGGFVVMVLLPVIRAVGDQKKDKTLGD